MGSPRKNTEQFIAEAKAIHGDKYDYSKVSYINNSTKVSIVCSTHGDFLQTPSSHLSGQGCPKCKCESRKKVVLGLGFNDMLNTRGQKFYDTWFQMLKRCYDAKFHTKNPTYVDCVVCDEWLILSNFKKWFDEHYVEGWALDKDILVKGNKVYSPETCCFVPQEISSAMSYRKKSKKQYPIGVYREPSGMCVTIIHQYGRNNRIGIFETVEVAAKAYKTAKETWIKELADKYKAQLEPRVYAKLYNWEIEITL